MAWGAKTREWEERAEDEMYQVDPWEKAADCERALRLTIDPVRREDLANIREFWISLANKRASLSENEFANEAETIGRFHARATATTQFSYWSLPV